MYGFLPFSLVFVSVFFPSQDQCERGMRHENDKIVISGDINWCDNGETEVSASLLKRELEYTAAEHEYERGDTLPSLPTLLCH